MQRVLKTVFDFWTYMYPCHTDCITRVQYVVDRIHKAQNQSYTYWLDIVLFNYTKITEINLSVFVYRLFHEDFPPIIETYFRQYLFSDN